MLDDHARADRLRQAPRTDLAMGERVFRFLSALQIRIVRELERLDPPARFHSEETGWGRRVRIAEGRVLAHGGVEVSVAEGSGGDASPAGSDPAPRSVTTGLTVDLEGAGPGAPRIRFHLRHTAAGDDPFCPETQGFDGAVGLRSVYPLGDAAVHFDGVWERLRERHPGVAGVDPFAERPHVSRPVPGDEGEGATGFRFECGGAADPEGAFLFVREVGRAFLPACIPVLERSVTLAAG